MGFFGFIKSKEGKRIALRLIGIYFGVVVAVWIFLWWYTDHGKQVAVPDLTNLTIQEATALLDEKDLSILIVDSIYDRKSKGGTIVEQSPAPESKVKEGRQVFVTVYRVVPPQEIVNISEGDFAQVAIIKLKNKGLDFETKYVPNNSMVGSVISITYKGRKLKSGDSVPRGDKVVLTVGVATEESVRIPNLQGLSYFQAMTVLDSLNLMGQAFFMYEVQSSADSAVGRICSQDPAFDPEAPGVTPGRIIDFRLFNTPCTDTTANP